MTQKTQPASVQIRADLAGSGSITVDGADISSLTSAVKLQIEAGRKSMLTLDLCSAADCVVEVEEGCLQIEGVTLPLALERALWRCLCKKYGHPAKVTNLASNAHEYALLGDS